MAMSLLAPSASASSCRARSAQTSVTAAVKLAPASGVTPRRAAGQQQDGVVGGHAAVGVDPVEGARRSPRAAPRRASAASTTASVVRTTSIVARPGASMPAPLAMPPTVQPSPVDRRRLGDGVGGAGSPRRPRPPPSRGQRGGGVRRRPGSSAVHRQPHADQAGGADGDARRRRCPARRRRARRWRGCRRSRRGPVQALAPPELRTTAREPAVGAAPAATHSTGAACTRLLVKTPAAASRGPSLTTSATSGRPLGLEPGGDARRPGSPAAAVTLTGRPR